MVTDPPTVDRTPLVNSFKRLGERDTPVLGWYPVDCTNQEIFVVIKGEEQNKNVINWFEQYNPTCLIMYL